MFPTTGDLHIAPFMDDALHMEQFQKANFWYQQSFHGVNLTCLREEAVKEYFKQPIVDTFDIRICMAKSFKHSVDFEKADEADLHLIDIPLRFVMTSTGNVHGLAFWFDVAFRGLRQTVWLSTTPTEPLTHWYQVRCLLPTPIFVQTGSVLCGRCLLKANARQSYDVDISLWPEGQPGAVSKNTLDLKNPLFRYTGQAPQPPPGHNTSTAQTETYWNSTVNGYGDAHMVDPAQLQQVVQPMTLSEQHVIGGAAVAGNQTPIHPGCIPAVGTLSAAQGHAQLPQQGISSQFLIGDYVAGNMQQLNTELHYSGLKPP